MDTQLQHRLSGGFGLRLRLLEPRGGDRSHDLGQRAAKRVANDDQVLDRHFFVDLRNFISYCPTTFFGRLALAANLG